MHLKVRSLANEESKFRDWNSAYQFTCASRGCWIPAQPFFQTQGAGTRTRLESSGVLGVRRSLRGRSLFCFSPSSLLPERRIALPASRLIWMDGHGAGIHFRFSLGSGSSDGLPNSPSSSSSASHQRASVRIKPSADCPLLFRWGFAFQRTSRNPPTHGGWTSGLISSSAFRQNPLVFPPNYSQNYIF